MAETPSSYKRFAQSDKISQGTTNAALSLNDYLPGQHVTGPNNNDIAATLAQVQAIPIGTATLSGNTYNVTISNYPNTATIYPGQKISVKFNADAPTADDTALNLSAFGQSLPLCARGVRMGQGAIKSGMILELVYRGDMWNADYDVVKANRDANGYTTFADGSTLYKNAIRYLFKGLALDEGTDTGLSVNASHQGKTYILIASGQWDSNNATSSCLYIIRCGFDNNNWELIKIVENNVNNIYRLNISISSSGTLILQSKRATWYCSILANKQ